MHYYELRCVGLDSVVVRLLPFMWVMWVQIPCTSSRGPQARPPYPTGLTCKSAKSCKSPLLLMRKHCLLASAANLQLHAKLFPSGINKVTICTLQIVKYR